MGDRLRDLKALHDDDLITGDEYDEKRQLIIDQLADPIPSQDLAFASSQTDATVW